MNGQLFSLHSFQKTGIKSGIRMRSSSLFRSGILSSSLKLPNKKKFLIWFELAVRPPDD